jgi:hypothetical protein
MAKWPTPQAAALFTSAIPDRDAFLAATWSPNIGLFDYAARCPEVADEHFRGLG